MNNQEWCECLAENYKRKNVNDRDANIKLPQNLTFKGDQSCAELFLSSNVLAKNMQADSAAFEGWALVLMRWCEVKRVHIDWEVPDDKFDPHYERFLYRLKRFSEMMGAPVSAPDIFEEAWNSSRLQSAKSRIVNVVPRNRSKQKPTYATSENGLEYQIAVENQAANNELCKKFGLEHLVQQFPVGVFDGPPPGAMPIFSAGRTDLIGVGADRSLWLFELKKAGNNKVGALSELFFYTAVLRDLRKKYFEFGPGGAGEAHETIRQCFQVTDATLHARILAPDVHPLVDVKLLQQMTAAAGSAKWNADFGHETFACMPSLQT